MLTFNTLIQTYSKLKNSIAGGNTVNVVFLLTFKYTNIN